MSECESGGEEVASIVRVEGDKVAFIVSECESGGGQHSWHCE